MAIQLRTLGPGSVSGALADCIAAGLPAVASAALADALDAPSYIRAVPDAPSPVLVAEAALALLGEAPRSGTEPERRAFVAGHGFDTYAVRLLEALGLDAPEVADAMNACPSSSTSPSSSTTRRAPASSAPSAS